MILQALYRLAQAEGLIGDTDYEWKPVAWLIRVGQDGELLGVEGTRYIPPVEEGKKKTARQIAESFLVPRQPVRTSANFAFFLCDKAEYVLGIDPDGKRSEKKLRERADLFLEKTEACAKATQDAGIQGVLRFLQKIKSGGLSIELPEKTAGNDLFAFQFADDAERLVSDRPAVRGYWKQLRCKAGEGGAEFRCLVSGQRCIPVATHPVLKRVPGGTSSGVSIVSFNAGAFESYGWRRNENAPISRHAAEACGTALNRLLAARPQNAAKESLPVRSYRLSANTVVCFWSAEKKSKDFLDGFFGLLEANPDEVKALYHSVWKGKPVAIDDTSAFYALTLSGSQGRAIVRGWFESTVSEVVENLARHFADLDIVRNTPKPKNRDLPPNLPLRALLRSLAPQGKDDAIPAPLADQFFRAALLRQPYPLSLLQRAIGRMRAQIGRSGWIDMQYRDARAAMIKATLNRRHRGNANFKEITRTMDPNNDNPGYLLGRLMAVIERIQQLAIGNVNASVVDRFFSGASATPRAVFTRLLKNARHHVAKAKGASASQGTAGWLDRQVDEIASRFDPSAGGFPAYLDLEQQGLFILGYHHMRHWLWLKKEDRDALSAETSRQADQSE